MTLDHPVIKEEIAQRVAGIRHRMDLAAREAGRSPRDIILCAAATAIFLGGAGPLSLDAWFW